MKVGRWSTTPGSNNATPPDGWPEGQAANTVNDCARENMAAIRTVFNDLQYFDQDYTPTFISTTSFSIPGNQTSAVHAGRRLKMFDATTLYGTVSTASFTTVTTIHIADGTGNLTSSLTSFAVAILSNDNNSLPRNLALTLSSLTVLGNIFGFSTIAASTHLGTGGTLSVSGAAALGGTLSVSGSIAAAQVAKAFLATSILSAGGIAVGSGFNISSISRSAQGVVRITFSTAFTAANFTSVVTLYGVGGSANLSSLSVSTTTCKFTCIDTNLAPTDGVFINAAFYHI